LQITDVGRQLKSSELWGSNPYPSTNYKGEIMTLDEQIDQLLVELISEEVTKRTIEQLKQLGVEVQ
jgi:hypothetical protein